MRRSGVRLLSSAPVFMRLCEVFAEPHSHAATFPHWHRAHPVCVAKVPACEPGQPRSPRGRAAGAITPRGSHPADGPPQPQTVPEREEYLRAASRHDEAGYVYAWRAGVGIWLVPSDGIDTAMPPTPRPARPTFDTVQRSGTASSGLLPQAIKIRARRMPRSSRYGSRFRALPMNAQAH